MYMICAGLNLHFGNRTTCAIGSHNRLDRVYSEGRRVDTSGGAGIRETSDVNTAIVYRVANAFPPPQLIKLIAESAP